MYLFSKCIKYQLIEYRIKDKNNNQECITFPSNAIRQSVVVI